MEGFVDDTNSAYSKQLEALGQVFGKASEADTPTEVRIRFIFFSFTISHSFCIIKKDCYKFKGKGWGETWILVNASKVGQETSTKPSPF